MRISVISLVFLLFMSFLLEAQVNLQGRQDMIEGNRLFEQGDYEGAEERFRRAIEQNAGPQAKFNLGNALYNQGRLDEAKDVFGEMEDYQDNPELLSRAFYNKGNIQLEQEELLESIESYKNALRWNPRDEDARYNLAYALSKLQQQPPQPENGDGEDENDEQEEEQDSEGQDDNGDGEQDDDQQDQEGEDQEDEQEQDAQADRGDEEEEQEQDSRQEEQPQGLDREDMERLLEALNQREQGLQEKWLEEQAGPADRTIDKDW